MCGTLARMEPAAVAFSLDRLGALPCKLRENDMRKCRSHGDLRGASSLDAAADVADMAAAKLARIGSLEEELITCSSGSLFTTHGLSSLSCHSQAEAPDRSGTASPSSVEPADHPPSPSGVVRDGLPRLVHASSRPRPSSPSPFELLQQQRRQRQSSQFSSSSSEVDLDALPFTESATPVEGRSPTAAAPVAAPESLLPCGRCSSSGACSCSSTSSSSFSHGTFLSTYATQTQSADNAGVSPALGSEASAFALSSALALGADRSYSEGSREPGLPSVMGRVGSCSGPLGFGPDSGSSSPDGRRSAEGSRRGSIDLKTASNEERRASQELFYRLNHARQTMEFVRRQATAFSALDKAEMSVWEALEVADSLREYEAALLGEEDADMSLMDHALQTAEACRLAFPEEEWMGLAGLLHGLGKLLAHTKLGAEPQWAICGESFPVGCRFHPAVRHSQLFAANPDRRKRSYATPTGIYREGCGLSSVVMSWSGPEYLYLTLCLNKTLLPPEALFCLRHQKFHALLRPGGAYQELLSAWDREQLPRLATFQQLIAYRRVNLGPQALQGQALRQHYSALLDKYIPQGKLRW